jgi:hypothetical protein
MDEGRLFPGQELRFPHAIRACGLGSSTAIIGYDSDKSIYTEQRFASSGRHVVTTGTLNGDTWTWTGQNNYGSMTVHNRMTIKMVSSTSYTMKYDVSVDGGSSWSCLFEGKATKQ